MLPESARWLISKKRNDDALKVLQNVAEVNKTELSEDTWNKFLENEGVRIPPKKFFFSIID
jgi:hypothetical protein